jgi:predicted TIM-barrel fold metal-dependent hydrolase
MAVIDSDAHVLETNHTWDYMLESERGMRPRIVPTPNDAFSGGESWLVDGTYIGKARNVGHDTSRESREMEDIKARLKHMDELDVNVQVLYPTIFLRPFTRRVDVELAVTRSYNRWLIDIWKAAPDRLRWVAVLPLLSMDKAIEEARYAKENGACGIFMRGLEGDKHISDAHFFRSTKKRAGSICRSAFIPRPGASQCMTIFSTSAASTSSNSRWWDLFIR